MFLRPRSIGSAPSQYWHREGKLLSRNGRFGRATAHVINHSWPRAVTKFSQRGLSSPCLKDRIVARPKCCSHSPNLIASPHAACVTPVCRQTNIAPTLTCSAIDSKCIMDPAAQSAHNSWLARILGYMPRSQRSSERIWVEA